MNSELTLNHVAVTGNSVGGSPALTLAGGGIYTRDPITFHSSMVRHNRPDQCSGCTESIAAASTVEAQPLAGMHDPALLSRGTDLVDRLTIH